MPPEISPYRPKVCSICGQEITDDMPPVMLTNEDRFEDYDNVHELFEYAFICSYCDEQIGEFERIMSSNIELC